MPGRSSPTSPTTSDLERTTVGLHLRACRPQVPSRPTRDGSSPLSDATPDMSLSTVQAAGRLEQIGSTEFDQLRSSYGAVAIDVGTGDGRFAYQLARSRPATLVIGTDPVAANMADVARRASRKPSRGGAPNLLMVQAAAEQPPPELVGSASALFVHLPWGRLLEGVVLGDAAVIGGLAALCAQGAEVTLTLNARIWEHDLPGRFRDLPAPTLAHVGEVVAPAFAAAGIVLGPPRHLGDDEMRSLQTTWAKRLSRGCNQPLFLQVDGRFAGVG